MNVAPEPEKGFVNDGLDLLAKAKCPHCWHIFAPEDALVPAASEALVGDMMLGPDAPMRFPPTRFTVDGLPRDGKGAVCLHMACPRCHLTMPRDLMVIPPTFVSIVGAPGTGKSYLLAAMVNQLRRTLPDRFHLFFGDADTVSNATLDDYERTLFHAADGSRFAALRKTEVRGGDLYNEVNIGGQIVAYPRPFLFSVRPMLHHAMYSSDGGAQGSMLVLYDNAGESFNPGADTTGSPVTRHVAHSDAILFLFDPTKDIDFRRRLTGDDPQLKSADLRRQTVILSEISSRIKNLTNLKTNQRHDKPLIVTVAKYDIWRGLLRTPPEAPPIFKGNDGTWRLDVGMIDNVSQAVREMLKGICPDLVSTAESIWSSVRYVPTSATGCSPVQDPSTGALGFRPMDLHPIWADVPLLMFMADRWKGSMLPVGLHGTKK